MLGQGGVFALLLGSTELTLLKVAEVVQPTKPHPSSVIGEVDEEKMPSSILCSSLTIAGWRVGHDVLIVVEIVLYLTVFSMQ